MKKTMLTKRSALLALSVGALSACAATPGVDATADRATLIEAAESFHAAAGAKDRESVVALFDTGAIMLPPDGDRVDGVEGVQGYRFGFLATPGVELDFEILEAEVSASGDLGWTLAIADITIRDESGVVGRDRVRDVHAWKRQPDGSWRIALDVWNSAPVPDL